MVLDEHLPGVHRPAMAIALARTAIDDRGALLALPVGVDTSIEGVLQNRDDIAIPDRPPLDRRQRPAIGTPPAIRPRSPTPPPRRSTGPPMPGMPSCI